MSFLPRCTSAAEAIASLRTHGAAILARESEYCISEATIGDLYKWCVGCDEYMEAHWHVWKDSSRHMNPDVSEGWKRFSMNDRGNWKYQEWEDVVEALSRPDGVLSLVQLILGVSARISTLGGDTVREQCKVGQHLHSDGGSVRSVTGASRIPMQECAICPYLVLSICVHDISKEMGAFYFSGIHAMYSVDDTIPSLYTPQEFDEHFGFDHARVTGCCVMRPGDMLLRNPLVWHAGTPNCTNARRYLPACIFAPKPKEAVHD